MPCMAYQSTRNECCELVALLCTYVLCRIDNDMLHNKKVQTREECWHSASLPVGIVQLVGCTVSCAELKLARAPFPSLVVVCSLLRHECAEKLLVEENTSSLMKTLI